MIQKDRSHFSNSIKGTLIFRDDIEQIINRLKQLFSIIEIEDENYIYEDIDDFIKHKGLHPKSLKIGARNQGSHESININFNEKNIYISGYGLKNLYSLGFELKDYLSKRRRWYLRIFNVWIFLGGFGGSVLFLLNSLLAERKTDHPSLFWLTGILGFFLLISLLVNSMTYGLNLIRKHEYGFCERNKDKILLSIIAAIFGIIATLVTQWFVK